jgi:cell division protein FtsI (penicillin-binding protein 3)
MALKYKGLTPAGTERADLQELAHAPDPANAAYALLREAQGGQPAIQELVSTKGTIPTGKVRIPDMTGWPMRKALKEAIELGVTPQVQGSGLIAHQQPPPGQVVDKGTPLTLVFEPAS